MINLKRIKYFISFILSSAVVLTACGPSHDSTGDINQASVFTDGDAFLQALNRYNAGAQLYETNCSSCHGPLAASEKRGRSTGAIVGAIGDIGTMRYLSFLSSSDNSSISYVLNNDPPVPPVGNEAVDVNDNRKSKVLASNRNSLVESFKSLFVDSVNPDSQDENILRSLDNYVDSQHESFGGHESLHETDEIRGRFYNADTNLLNASQTPTMGVVRSGYVQRFCDETLARDKSLSTLLSQVGLSTSSPVNNANLEIVFDRFVPGRNPTPEILNALTAVGTRALSSGQSNTDAWRYTVLPLCRSGVAEVL